MHPGELWQHRKTRAVVRIEARRGGLLSFSIRQGKEWKMNPHVWVEEDFLKEFEALTPRRSDYETVLGGKVKH